MKRNLLSVLALTLTLVSLGCACPEGKSPSEQKRYTLMVRDEALHELYVREPEAQSKIEASAGYAFMSGFSAHPGILTFANAYGVVQNNKTGAQTYIRMTRMGIGPGIAVKGFYVVATLNEAELAVAEKGMWGGGGLAEASFKFGDTGGTAAAESYNVANGAWLWTHTGVALEVAGVWGKISREDDLN